MGLECFLPIGTFWSIKPKISGTKLIVFVIHLISYIIYELGYTHVIIRYALFVIEFFFVLSIVYVQYIPRNMHTVFALPCFVVVIHWLISHIHQAFFTGTVAI